MGKPKVVKFLHQGDVFVRPLESPPDLQGFVASEPILAYGETTGHSHRFAADAPVRFFRGSALNSYLLVEGDGAVLIHEEHGQHHIAPGWYEVRQQRERSLEDLGWRTVSD